MSKEQIEKDINKVEYCLKNFPETRNSDVTLTQKVWKEFHKEELLELNGKTYVDLEKMYEIPREDNLKRIRAKFQSCKDKDGREKKPKYLPTNIEVAKKRGINMDIWHKMMAFDQGNLFN